MLLIRARSAWFGCLLCLVNAVGAVERPTSLQLAVWGGDHGAMLDHAVLTPFSAMTGVKIQANARLDPEDGRGIDSIDVVELELHEAIDACDKGELALLPGSDLADFVPNALQPCAVGQYVWSTVFAFDQSAFKEGDQPSLISDFFNIGHYPGRPVYETLDQTDQAWQIIERILEPIAHSIVWVDDDAQALEMLEDGTVSFAMVGSDALIRSVTSGTDNLLPVWDGAVNQMSLWAIPLNSARPELAWQFIRYATSVDATRQFSTVSGYGPSRFTTLEQISSNYHQYLPSSRSNLSNIVWGNSNWWRSSGKALDLHFVNWLSNQFVKSDS